MEEDCGGGQGLSWAVEARERERERMHLLYTVGTRNRLLVLTDNKFLFIYLTDQILSNQH
jgi:hypothetical protein